ncbi:hypothetical protein LTR70_000887 [Exophiala xenobiotica]|uniref:Uncharacterized protein n=1 Tax=Lithohypha guttulata TaxID=1690604 RepID=A0ABR0KK69_9EURO|nr:hypothetical protein LTR24_001620 [Lithohypha guttulata]KAK5329051.1 hypothetical protein LTR70_000887 [Exophiala xenobiotica]
MAPTKKADTAKDDDTTELRQYPHTGVKRKHGSSYTLDPLDELDSATKEAIEKQDRLDETFEPEDGGKPADKKPKTSRKQQDSSNLYCSGIYSPPERGRTKSRKDWAMMHSKKTMKQFPDSRKVSVTELRAAYEGSKALNIFLHGELEYQCDLGSDLRKKRTEHLLMIDELKVALGVTEPVKVTTKKQKDEAQESSPPKTAQAGTAPESRFESISTNLASEVGSLKMQLELEKHDKVAAEQANQSAQRELEDVKAQNKLLRETVVRPSAALRTELAEHQEPRKQAEKQLKQALSDRRTREEAEFWRLKKVMDDRIAENNSRHTKNQEKLEVANRELKEKLAKQDEELRLKETKLEEQRTAIVRAKACLSGL